MAVSISYRIAGHFTIYAGCYFLSNLNKAKLVLKELTVSRGRNRWKTFQEGSKNVEINKGRISKEQGFGWRLKILNGGGVKKKEEGKRLEAGNKSGKKIMRVIKVREG